MKKLLAFGACALFGTCAGAGENGASWIWYPGDFENFLSAQFSSKITYKGALSPADWKISGHYPCVYFFKDYDIKEPETVKIASQGKFAASIDRKIFFAGEPPEITLPAGRHTLKIAVFNYEKIPAIRVDGPSVKSDRSWRVKIDRANAEFEEVERARGLPITRAATDYGFCRPDNPPAKFELPRREIKPAKTEKSPGKIFSDFGEETFGFVKFKGLRGKGTVAVYYGESPEEANSDEHCEVFGKYSFDLEKPADVALPDAQGFRYARAVFSGGLAADEMLMDFEYADIAKRGSFKSSDGLLNRIWDVSYRTLFLTAREFFVDGVKRDRWVWAGDAAQSYLMNYYSFFDLPTARRTLWANRGKEPDTKHVNRIMDYSFYWLDSVREYYLYTGDSAFVKDIYPRMKTLADFCISRADENGFAVGRKDDWVFLDWAPMPKSGILCAEQILFARALDSLSECAKIAGESEDCEKFAAMSRGLKGKTLKLFWDDARGTLRHSYENGNFSEKTTRYAGMFAVLFGFLDAQKAEKIRDNILLNDSVQKITTPYMRFYELAALCEIGKHDYVLDEIKSYWGGMLKEGATSFWEVYNPDERGAQHTAMYGRPFGRSFCHSWGASPLFLLGRYFAGVRPTKAGYSEYEAAPELSKLGWFKASVPTPFGEIKISMDKNSVEIKSDGGIGTIRLKSAAEPVCPGLKFKSDGGGKYSARIEPKKTYRIRYEKI